MKSKTLTWFIAMTLFATLSVPVHLAAQHTRYKLIDIGTLGGPNSSPPASFFERIQTESLSRAGTFAGQAETSTPDPFAPNCFNPECLVSHAIQWRDGVLTDLGALHSSESLSSAIRWISVNGLIAGFSENGEIDPLNPGLLEIRAALWKHGKITDLGTLEGGTESEAFAVNARGQAVGGATNGIPDPSSLVGVSTQVRAFLWQNGAMQDLGTLPGGTDALALLVNERGQIVGESYAASSIPPQTPFCDGFPLTPHGFLWENGKIEDIGTLGGNCAFTYAINNRGQVVGQSTVEEDQELQPYIWDRKRGIRNLGTLGGTHGSASWINDPGAVVGSSTNQGNQALLAFLWKDGVISNLGTLPGNACSIADAINSAGQIVGGSGFYDADFFPACTDLVECTGETVAVDIAFAGVLTQTVTNPGGALEENHFDSHVTVLGTGIGQTTGIQYVTNETFHNSEAGKMVFPFIQTITDNFRFVSKGGSSNLAISVTLHLTITATGEAAVTFDNARTYCQ